MTTSAVVTAILLIHLGVILVVTAYYTVGAVLAPRITGRGRARFAARPWLPVIVGVAVSVPWVAVSLTLLAAPAAAAKFAGAVLGCLWVLAGLIGGAGLAQHIGSAGATAGAPWIQTVRGGLLISLTWVLPLVGWLGMLPLTMATGVGCLITGLWPLASADSPPVADPAPTWS